MGLLKSLRLWVTQVDMKLARLLPKSYCFHLACDLILYPQKAKKLEEAKVHHTTMWPAKKLVLGGHSTVLFFFFLNLPRSDRLQA
nr:hypothetical protein CFP56_62071 [Quercus suber]